MDAKVPTQSAVLELKTSFGKPQGAWKQLLCFLCRSSVQASIFECNAAISSCVRATGWVDAEVLLNELQVHPDTAVNPTFTV